MSNRQPDNQPDQTITVYVCPRCQSYDSEPGGCVGGEDGDHPEAEMEPTEFVPKVEDALHTMPKALEQPARRELIRRIFTAPPDSVQNQARALGLWPDYFYSLKPDAARRALLRDTEKAGRLQELADAVEADRVP